MNQDGPKRFMTDQARELYELLKQGGINAESEYSDGHKHVDIAIRDAHIYIEVDGLHHFTDPAHIEADFKRSHYSDKGNFDTIHIPNLIIEHHLQEVADAIIQVVNKRLGATP